MNLEPWKYALSCLLIAPLLSGCGGCRDSTTAPGEDDQQGQAAASQYREELLAYAVDNLDRLDEYGSAGMLPQIIHRLDSMNRRKPGESEEGFDSLTTAWPESEMLRQIVDRLNQWIRPRQHSADWKPDPMIASLPKPLAELPQVKNLGQMEFTRFDGYALREAAWLRDVSLWARGERLDDLQRAKSIFDWTVRNVQIEADHPDRTPLFPWETLLFGRGTVAERAWVFVLLLRQLDIDAALLAVDRRKEAVGKGEGVVGSPTTKSASEERTTNAEKNLRPWCVGVLIEGKIYLFDPRLGLPIPAPNGVEREKTGQLTIRPADLKQVADDDKLLDGLNIEGVAAGRPYGVQASDLDRVTVLLEASPPYLSRCMKLLESRLSGNRKMVLTTAPSDVARRWESAGGVRAVRLWRYPFQTLLRRSSLDRERTAARLAAMLPFYVIPSAPLYRGRVLYLKGKLVGDDGAMQYYQQARPSNAELRASSADTIEKMMLIRGKQDASFWCGLIAFERGDYDVAADYFRKRTLEPYPNGPWTRGAKYNLARAYEASGQTERAILQYGSDASSPGYRGDLLRAKWLREENKRIKPTGERTE